MLTIWVCILFMSLTMGESPDEKPSYLYDTPAVYTLATEIEPRIYSAIKRYLVANSTGRPSCVSCCVDKNSHSRTLALMKAYIRDYEASSINAISIQDSNIKPSPTEVVSNPFLVHKLINRFASIYPEIIGRFKNKETNNEVVEAEAFLHSLPNEADMPFPTKSDDLYTSLTSLLRIQRYSKFETKDMVEGRLGAFDTGIQLSASESFDLGVAARAHSPQYFALSIEWLETALKKLDKEQWDLLEEKFRDMIQKELEEVVKEHDKVCSSSVWNPKMETCFETLINSPYYKNASTGIPQGPDKVWILNQKRSALLHKIPEKSLTPQLRRNFISLCAGNVLMSEEERSRLKCWYERDKNPYLKIAPLKFEQLSASPELFQIYDILGPKTMQRLKRYAVSSGLERSLVMNTRMNDGKHYLSDTRTSAQVWLDETGNDSNLTNFLNSISRRIEIATGLTVFVPEGDEDEVVCSEPFQVVSYRTSHHYDVHKDAYGDGNMFPDCGNRIATFMFYLSDVQVGGGTGFPVAGVATRPVSGSAAFWYNLKKNGDVDDRTWHGGCPVAYGVKWVANKWIWYNPNFDKRLCSLNPKE